MEEWWENSIFCNEFTFPVSKKSVNSWVKRPIVLVGPWECWLSKTNRRPEVKKDRRTSNQHLECGSPCPVFLAGPAGKCQPHMERHEFITLLVTATGREGYYFQAGKLSCFCGWLSAVLSTLCWSLFRDWAELFGMSREYATLIATLAVSTWPSHKMVGNGCTNTSTAWGLDFSWAKLQANRWWEVRPTCKSSQVRASPNRHVNW